MSQGRERNELTELVSTGTRSGAPYKATDEILVAQSDGADETVRYAESTVLTNDVANWEPITDKFDNPSWLMSFRTGEGYE